MAAKKKPKHTITAKEHIDISYIPLKELIPELQELMKEYGGDAKIQIEVGEYDHYTSYITWERPESAEERHARLCLERENREWRKKQYEALKEEFGE